MRELRPDQEQAIGLLRTSIKAGHRKPIMQAPCGYGKTMVAIGIIRGALAKGNRILFSVPAITLIEQTRDALIAEGLDERLISIMQADDPRLDWGKPVQVCSVQTLERRKAIPPCDLVIIDECHVLRKFYAVWMAREEWKAVPFIGLSATPWTRGLGTVFDDLIVVARTDELIKRGLLSPFRVFAPAVKPDLRQVRTIAGDYREDELAEVMGEKKIVADVVNTWRELADERQTFVFAVDRAHARKLADEFETAGVSTAYMDAYTGLEEREAIKTSFHAGEVRVVVNVGVLLMGVDWRIQCLSIARPTKSDILHVQMIGRALRTEPGKADALLLDHAGNNLRLGMVTDIHHDGLDDGKPLKHSKAEKKVPLPHECQRCHYLMAAHTTECPSCGWVSRRQSTVTTINGTLVETGQIARPSLIMKQRWHAELYGYAKANNKSDKWVLAMFRSKFGEWPSRYYPAPVRPSAEVINYVRSRNIAYAKRMAKEKRATA